jgi:hypothetical protein
MSPFGMRDLVSESFDVSVSSFNIMFFSLITTTVVGDIVGNFYDENILIPAC